MTAQLTIASVVDWLGVAGNALAIVGLLLFVALYSRVHWERNRLGHAVMGSAVSMLALAGVALVYRLSVILGWPFVELTWLKILIAAAWAAVGLANFRKVGELLAAQAAHRREEAGR